jgi:DNA-directed RNA polymerase subunit RPC12/RpoP
MTPPGDARMAAGIASIGAHERALAESQRLDAERAAAVPAPPSIANRPGRAERKAAESVRCPYCKSPAGQPCHGARQRPMAKPHPSRAEAYAVQTAACPECGAEPGEACRNGGSPYRPVTHPSRLDFGQQP